MYSQTLPKEFLFCANNRKHILNRKPLNIFFKEVFKKNWRNDFSGLEAGLSLDLRRRRLPQDARQGGAAAHGPLAHCRACCPHTAPTEYKIMIGSLYILLTAHCYIT
jgi:hypothetical protein